MSQCMAAGCKYLGTTYHESYLWQVVPKHIYFLLSLYDFICVGCSQSGWLYLDSRCGINSCVFITGTCIKEVCKNYFTDFVLQGYLPFWAFKKKSKKKRFLLIISFCKKILLT